MFWRKFRKSRFAKWVIMIFLCLIAAVFFWPVDCLTGEHDGNLLFAWPIRVGECFEVTFTHSLNLSPITDIIEWSGKDQILRKSVFKTFGAGVPIPQDGIGTELIHIDGKYELIGIDKHMQSFTIMTQEVPNHQINLREREAFLLKLTGSGKTVDIAVKRVSLAVRLWLMLV